MTPPKSSSSNTSTSDSPTHSHGPHATPRRLLVVEDDRDTRFVIETLLAETYRVHLAATVDEAVDKAESNTYDIFLIDISLNGRTSGVDLMQQLRETPAYADAPMIAMTAHVVDERENRFLEQGFDLYLAKPFDLDELDDCIQKAGRMSS